MFILIFCFLTYTASGKGRNADPSVSLNVPLTLLPGKNKIDLLSLTVGLQVRLHIQRMLIVNAIYMFFNAEVMSYQNYGAYFDMKGAGITGPVQLKSSQSKSIIDLSTQLWTYQVDIILNYAWFWTTVSIFLKFSV